MIQREVLKNLILDQKLCGIEIGTLEGDTVAFLLENIPYLEIFTIDKLPVREKLIEKIKDFGNRIKIIELKSDDAIKALVGEFNFVWIDGEHTYEQTKKDIENYWPLIKRNGFIGGHDYNSSFPGVEKAVKEIFGEKIILGEDGTWWIYKDV